MTRADFGRATEARFIMDAQRQGLLVSRPFDSVPGYDAVVDNGKRLFRVQVKGVRARHRRGQRGRREFYLVNTNRYGTRMQFDVVAVWLDGEARWVFLPGATRNKRQVLITPQGKHSRIGWEIFRRKR